MAKNLGSAVIKLLEHDRVDLRAAAATVLGAVGGGEPQVVDALTDRLADGDAVVRGIALEGLASMGVTGIAPRLIPLLRGDDEALAERAARMLASQGAAAEAALRRELGHGTVQVRRAMASLLVERGTASALEAVLDQLGDPELGEQVLQLLRAEVDRGQEKAIGLIEKSALTRAAAAGKRLRAELARASKAEARARQGSMPAPGRKDGAAGDGKGAGRVGGGGGGGGGGKAGDRPAMANGSDPLGAGGTAGLIAPSLALGAFELGLLLRLIGYLARPSSLPLLIAHVSEDQPRSIRLAAIAAMRRVVATSEAKSTDKAIEILIALADASDLVVAQAAIDTLRGARVPERLARAFAGLVKSHNPAAQKLAMERLPAGGGAAAVRALIDAIGGGDISARDAAARGLARAPEAVGPLVRALVAATDAEVARRYAGVLRSHRGQVSTAAAGELADAAQRLLDQQVRARAGAAAAAPLLAVLMEILAEIAPARYVDALFEQARKLRRADRVAEAFGALRPLLRSHAELDAAIDDDRRYLLAVLGLQTLGQGILRASGADAPILAQFARLHQRRFPVARRLAREKDVGDQDVYALGFRLLESNEGADQELGAELMQGLIDERPRSKVARNARNKLKLAGYLDD